MSFRQFHQACLTRFDSALKSELQLNADAHKLLQAMAYSALNGGKRVRPMLVYAACQAVNGLDSFADKAAVAVEMIHCYSLVHDDLPAMDDDDLRRGQPTCHIQFDEATAILAGDALQSQAFAILSAPHDIDAQQQLKMVQLLSEHSGVLGMAGGQSLDLEAVDKQVDLAYLENMHNHKTGALILASVLLGAHTAKVSADTLNALTTYANAIGLAFQVQDDILDVISDTQTLGKQQGADAALNKPTYVSLLGLDGAKAKAHELHRQAVDSLQKLDGDSQALKDIADYIIERLH